MTTTYRSRQSSFPRLHAALVAMLMTTPLFAQEEAARRDIRPSNEVKLEYEYEEFERVLEPWRTWTFEYTRRGSKGSITGRVNQAERFGRDGTQFEVDAYPRLRKGTYAYVSAGFSNDSIFPDRRYGLQIYQSLPRSWEISAGTRRLEFERSEVNIWTGSIGKYSGNYYLSLQPYITERSGEDSRTGVLTVRRYFATADDYVSFRGSYGEAPLTDLFLQTTTRTNSWSAAMEVRRRLMDNLIIEGEVGFREQEISPSVVRESFTVSAGLRRRF